MEDCVRQRARDAIMKGVEIDADTLQELRDEGKNPNQWSGRTFQQRLFGHDGVSEANRIFDKSEGKAKSISEIVNGEQSSLLKAVEVN